MVSLLSNIAEHSIGANTSKSLHDEFVFLTTYFLAFSTQNTMRDKVHLINAWPSVKHQLNALNIHKYLIKATVTRKTLQIVPSPTHQNLEHIRKTSIRALSFQDHYKQDLRNVSSNIVGYIWLSPLPTDDFAW